MKGRRGGRKRAMDEGMKEEKEGSGPWMKERKKRQEGREPWMKEKKERRK